MCQIFSQQKISSLLSHLKDSEDWNRHQVKQYLRTQDSSVVAHELETWIQNLNREDIQFEHHLLEALWTYQRIGKPNEKLLHELLRAKDARARAAAVRILKDWQSTIANPLDLLILAIKDPHPLVRLETIVTLSQIPKAESVRIVTHALDQPRVSSIDLALRLAVERLIPHWYPALKSGKLKFDQDHHQTFAVAHLRSSEVIEAIVQMLDQTDSIDQHLLQHALNTLARTGNENTLGILARELTGTETPSSTSPPILTLLAQTLHRAAIERNLIPAFHENNFLRLLESSPPPLQESLIDLSGSWKVNASSSLLEHFTKTHSSPAIRIAAAKALATLGGTENEKKLLSLTQSAVIQDLYTGLIGLAHMDSPEIEERISDAFAISPRDQGSHSSLAGLSCETSFPG